MSGAMKNSLEKESAVSTNGLTKVPKDIQQVMAIQEGDNIVWRITEDWELEVEIEDGSQ